MLIIGTYNEDGTPTRHAAWGHVCVYAGTGPLPEPQPQDHRQPQGTGAFTVHFADAAHVVPADYVGLVSGQDQPDKLAKAGLHGEKSLLWMPPC